MSSNPSELSELTLDSLLPLNLDDSLGEAQDEANEFSQVRQALTRFLEQPEQLEAWEQFRQARCAAVAAILKISRKDILVPATNEVRQLVKELSGSGVHDRAVSADDLALAQSSVVKGWQGLLAAMLLTPAWQWREAPSLVAVPAWLRTDYVAWLFAAPQGFSELGQAESYATYALYRLEELVRWIGRSPGAAAEAEVLEVYVSKSSVIPLYFSTDTLRRHATLRGRLLQRALGNFTDDHEPVIQPRNGRRLRVGVVNRHFGSQTETYTTLPTFEQLDPARFEVILYCHRANGGELEAYCCKHAAGFVELPSDLPQQVALLREAALDVVMFGTNITAVYNEVLRLALYRIAPLQVINNSSCITSGLPHSDLYVSGELTELAEAAEHFSERLALLPGPTHAFNYEADHLPPSGVLRRDQFGLPAEALVFVSAANFFKIIPEMQHAWARILAAVPGAYLLVHPFNPNWSSRYPIKRFQAEFERVLRKYGVTPDRLVISTERFPSRTDVKALLGLGNIYLDSHPFGGVNSLVDPLELGLPVITWDGTTMRGRMGGALLRSLGLNELIANSAEEYHALAQKLALDQEFRERVGEQIRHQMGSAPVFLDSLAASDALGDLLETAFDELAQVGRAAFRANREPLRTKASLAMYADVSIELAQAQATLRRVPNDARSRHIVGRNLLERGQHKRAVTYLLAALQGEEANVDLWIDVARALKADGQLQESLQALEAGLRIDQTSLEGWVLYAELAHTLGSTEIAREAAGVARQLAPEDSRVNAYL